MERDPSCILVYFSFFLTLAPNFAQVSPWSQSNPTPACTQVFQKAKPGASLRGKGLGSQNSDTVDWDVGVHLDCTGRGCHKQDDVEQKI